MAQTFDIDDVLNKSVDDLFGKKDKKSSGSKKVRLPRTSKNQTELTDDQIEAGRRIATGSGFEGVAKETLRNIILGDREYLDAKRQLAYIQAHKADYKDSKIYQESVDKLIKILKYRAEIYANITSPKAKNERKEALKNDENIKSKKIEREILFKMEQFLKPSRIEKDYLELTLRMEDLGLLKLPEADFMLDDELMDESDYIIKKNKELVSKIYEEIRELQTKDNFATYLLQSMNKSLPDEVMYAKYSILIYLIINSGNTKHTVEEIIILGYGRKKIRKDKNGKDIVSYERTSPELLKLVKDNIDVFKSNYLKDDVGKTFTEKLEEITKEIRIAESTVMSSRVGEFIHDKYGYTKQDLDKYMASGKTVMSKNLKIARETFTSEMIPNACAMVKYICHTKGIENPDDVSIVESAALEGLATWIDDFMREFLNTYEESKVFLSFNSFVGWRLYPIIQNQINQIRTMGMFGSTGNHFIYKMGIFKRLMTKMFEEHPEYLTLKNTGMDVSELFEIYVAEKRRNDPKLDREIGDFVALNGANFGLSLDEKMNDDDDEKRSYEDVIANNEPLPSEIADFNLAIERDRDAIISFFTEIRYIHRYDEKEHMFYPLQSRGIFDENLVQYLLRRLAIVRDNPKTKSDTSSFAGYYDNDKDISAKLGITGATISTYLNGKNNSLQDKLKDVADELVVAANDYPQLSGYYRKLRSNAIRFNDFIEKFVGTYKNAKNETDKKKMNRNAMISLIANLDIQYKDVEVSKFNESNFPSKRSWKKQ